MYHFLFISPVHNSQFQWLITLLKFSDRSIFRMGLELQIKILLITGYFEPGYYVSKSHMRAFSTTYKASEERFFFAKN
jgi:hypothetical protein